MELYENNFYGDLNNEELILIPEEASLLIERGRISIYVDQTFSEEISLGKYISKVSEGNPEFWVKYLVYKDLRSRGYVVRAGYGGGRLVPFRKYPRGARPNKSHSDTFIYPFAEGSSIEPHEFDLMVSQAQSNRKSLLLGIVDRSGDVTYYKASEFKIPINEEEYEWKNE
jgi:tRNA-intron endonuclease